MHNSEKKWFQKLLAPFYVLKIEKIYFVWIISFFVSFAGVIVDILNGNIELVINQGSFL